MVACRVDGEMRVLVTGASGFVGHHLCSRLLADGWKVRVFLRDRAVAAFPSAVDIVRGGSLGAVVSRPEALAGVHTVVHLAARVHVMNDPAADPLALFRKANVDLTRQVANASALAGVKRLVYVSTVKVNGEEAGEPYREDSPPSPTDPYGVSKWEAEQCLRQIERETGLEVVIIRPPLVYGPGVKANFLAMMNAVRRGIPLPFALIANKRSLIYVGNLVDALATCTTHPAAAGKTYLVSDGRDVSTPELVRLTAKALGVPERLVPLPVALLRLAACLAGRTAFVNRLLGSLTVDISAIRSDLGWNPPFTVDEGLRETAAWFKEQL